MLPSTLAKRGYLLLFVVVIAFYFYGLGYLPFVGPDEPRYAQVAREMLMRGDPITPTLGGHNWFEKPVLLYWLIAAGFRLFGISEWAARLGPAACGVLTMLAVYWIGRKTELLSGDPELRGFGYWGSMVLATTPGIVVFSRAASFDIVVTMTLTWSLAFFFAAEIETDKRRERWYLVAFYIFVGLSLLAKGLIGIVIPCGVIFLYYPLRRMFPKAQLVRSLLWGLPLALLVAASWYGPVIARHGWQFIHEFFIEHHFVRYLSNKYHHPQPIFYYPVILFPLVLPWIALFIEGLVKARRWHWQGSTATDRIRVFAFAWILLPLIFFSLSSSKLPGYILPILPAVALVSGERLTRIIAGKRPSRTMQFIAGTLIILAAGIIIYNLATEWLTGLCAVLTALPLLLSSLLILLYPTRHRLSAVSIVIALIACFTIALNCGGQIAEVDSARILIAEANARGFNSTPLYALHEIERSSEFYAAGRVVYDSHGQPVKFEGTDDVVATVQKTNAPLLVIVPLRFAEQLTDLNSVDVEMIAENGVHGIFAVSPKRYSR